MVILFHTLSAGAQAFLGPDQITCEGQVSYRVILNSGKSQAEPSGKISLKIQRTPAIEFVDQKKRLAKLYPADGLDSVVFDKKAFKVQTNERTYWELYDTQGRRGRLVRCQVNR